MNLLEFNVRVYRFRMLDEPCPGNRAPRPLADPLAVRDCKKKRRAADVPIAGDVHVAVRFSHRAGILAGHARIIGMCVHTPRATSSSHESWGLKEGFIFVFFFTGLSMLRSHILQRTHITITLKPFFRCVFGRGRESYGALNNYIRDTTGSYFVCVRGSYIHVLCCISFLRVRVPMVRHWYFLVRHVFLGVRIDLAWTEVDSKQASDECEGESENFTRSSLTSGHRCTLLSGRARRVFLIPGNLPFLLSFLFFFSALRRWKSRGGYASVGDTCACACVQQI